MRRERGKAISYPLSIACFLRLRCAVQRRAGMTKAQVQPFLAVGLLILLVHAASAHWVQTSLTNRDVVCLAVSDNSVFAGTTGGVYLSPNNGANWTAINSGLTDTFVEALAAGGGTIFAGTNNGVFRSTNNGTDWNLVRHGSGICLALSGINVFDDDGLSGIYRSTNNGTSWTPVSSGGLANANVYALAVRDSTIFAGTANDGIFISTDNGTSWASVDSGFSRLQVRCLLLSGSSVYTGTYGGGLYLSTNNGASWAAGNSGLWDNSVVHEALTVMSLAASGSNVFAATRGDSMRIGSTNTGVFLSTNDGTSWTEVDSGLTAPGVCCLAASDSDIFAGTQADGVWRRPISEVVGVIGHGPQRGMQQQVNMQVHSASHANPNMTIEFSLPHPDRVTVVVYDLSGREVASLVNRYLGSGAHSMAWNTRSLATGCYTVRTQAGSNTRVSSIPVFR
jgi:hypothetical protein